MPAKEIKRLKKSIDQKDSISQVLQNDFMYHNRTYAKLFTKKLAFVIVKKLKHQKEHRLKKQLFVQSAAGWFRFVGKKLLLLTMNRIFI